MRWFLVLLIAVTAVPAVAATAAKYEGTYNAALTLKPGLDGPNCPTYDLKPLHVEKGQIQPNASQPLLSGTIDDMGLLDGHMHKPDGGDVAFQGYIQVFEYDSNHTHFTATIIDDRTGCGWALSLVHE